EKIIMKSLIVLTQPECKRIIAKGILKHPHFKHSYEKGKIFLARGSTNAYILEEIKKESIQKQFYVAGQITGAKEINKRYGGVSSSKQMKEVILEKKQIREIDDSKQELEKFSSEDLIIKGGNILDDNYIAGVYIAHPNGGTIGNILPIAVARGIPILVPISLNKRSSEDVYVLAQLMGNATFKPELVMGHPIGIMPIIGEVFTELDAFELLFPEVEFVHIGSGGVGKAEGSLHFLIIGEEDKVKNAFNEIKKIIENEKDYLPIIE
ncbi:MAG: hypothetical protein ACTSQ6_08285, partial [Candidatus Heimdallarchaeaceae archaeon]